jgi:hypothetical protein
MKNILLLFILTFVYTSGNAQGVPEKANTIIITLADTNTINEKILKVLTGKDYPVKSNKASSSILAGPKTLKNNTRVSLNAQIKGAEIILTGKILIATEGSKVIEYKGAKGTPIMAAWEEMDKVAKALGGKVRYEVK